MDSFELTTMTLYVFTTVASAIGFGLFSWWWLKKGSATPVYSYITLLFGAQAIEQGVEGLTYYYFATSNPIGNQIVNSVIWPVRLLLVGVIVAIIVFHVISRIKTQMIRIKSFEKRRTSRPDKDFTNQVLVVDDHSESLSLIERAIKLAFPNVTVYTAENAEDALDAFTEHNDISLIVTDLLLPKMNGFELCALIKDECPWTIVLGMTGYISVYEFWTAREVGFDDYIQKPFHVSEVIDVVRHYFGVLERWKTIRVGRRKPKKKERKNDEREIVESSHPGAVCGTDSGSTEKLR